MRDPHAEPAADLVNRQFTATTPNRLWVTDITEHRTEEGRLYRTAVMDAYSRRMVGWSIADRIRTELVLDALGMAIVRRPPNNGETILHSTTVRDTRRGHSVNESARPALLGSMGSVGHCCDNAMMESFWGTLQLEVLDQKNWNTRDELANAIFEWIVCWYNPTRRHSSIGMRSPVDFEHLHTPSDHDR